MSVTRFGLLGPLEVLADGQPLALGGPQQRGLLAVLLLDANRVVSWERLVSDLWGDDPPATARSLLVALAGLAACHLRLGQLDRAVALAEHAAAGATDGGFRVVAAEALTILLDVHLTASDLDKALDRGRRALDLHRATGHRHGEARTVLLLDHAFRATEDTTAANR